MASIKTRTGALSISRDAKEIRALLEADLVDMAALRATVAAAIVDITALDTSIDTLIAKLNLDGGVTDVNYAGAVAMTAAAPSALTVVE